MGRTEAIAGIADMLLRHPRTDSCTLSGQTVRRTVEVGMGQFGEGVFTRQHCTEHISGFGRNKATSHRVCGMRLEGVEYKFERK